MWKRLTLLWSMVRGDARALWFALRHPAAPVWLKIGTGLIAVYLLSPIDLLPDTIPLLGVMDDLVIVPFAIRFLLDRLPPGIRADVERRVGRRKP
ncbi:YkvA family protein [Caldimonas tepidiphila]|uniref:YkvA family protein n=1 Tax=Caldimonas tepidiphila TaxID=2315841 RepID=UPI000E5A72DE|nr:YkvA family protein [Caldimonas tepidiphila]